MSRLAPVAPPFHLPFPPTPVPGVAPRRPSYDVLGDPLHVLLTAEESHGERSVFLMEHRPGSAVPSHVHDDKTEAFHVLEGAYVFEVGGVQRRVEAGSSALVPAGTSHGFRVDGPGERRPSSSPRPAGSRRCSAPWTASACGARRTSPRSRRSSSVTGRTSPPRSAPPPELHNPFRNNRRQLTTVADDLQNGFVTSPTADGGGTASRA